MGKDIEEVGEKATGHDLPAYAGSTRRNNSGLATEVLAGEVFEGQAQATQRVS